MYVYEVEQKLRIQDTQGVRQELAELDAVWAAPVRQVDRYLAHPCRDFATTDEALRIRSVGSVNCITYKGPKLDQLTKTRREIELSIADGPVGATDFVGLLEALGFQPVADVCKQRTTATFTWQSRQVEVALDDVDNVGLFAELETSADDENLDAARQSIQALAARLGLTDVERRSYLELLLEG